MEITMQMISIIVSILEGMRSNPKDFNFLALKKMKIIQSLIDTDIF